MSSEERLAAPARHQRPDRARRSRLVRWAVRQVLYESDDHNVRRTYEATAAPTRHRHPDRARRSRLVRWAARQVLYESYDRTVQRIYAFCLVYTTTREQAEELTAQTFERAFTMIVDGHPPQEGRSFAWLLRIAAMLVAPPSDGDVEPLAENWERADVLRERLKALPSAYDRHLQVPSLEGLSPQQRAAHPGLTEQEAWQLLGSIGITPSNSQRLLGAVAVRDLGPFLLAQEQAEADPPDPGFLHDLRLWLATPGRHRDLERTQRAQLTRWTVGTALLVALWILLVVTFHEFSRQRPEYASPIWTSPRLSVSDLTRNYPSPFGDEFHATPPTVSVFDPPRSIPFLGHFEVSAGVFDKGALLLFVYRLQGRQLDARQCDRLAQLAGIRAGVTTRARGSAVWFTAVDGAGASSRSLSVSAVTGEVIYHGGTAHSALTARPRSDAGARAVARARAWLTRLGWPGARMPLHSVSSGPEHSEVVALGWPGIGATDTSAVTLQIAVDETVTEARLWPPVAQSGTVRARGIEAAWQDLQRGAAPVAVENLVVGAGTQLIGTVARVEVVHVLSAKADGSLYLVPAYRFEGTARLKAAILAGVAAPESITAQWYALLVAQA